MRSAYLEGFHGVLVKVHEHVRDVDRLLQLGRDRVGEVLDAVLGDIQQRHAQPRPLVHRPAADSACVNVCVCVCVCVCVLDKACATLCSRESTGEHSMARASSSRITSPHGSDPPTRSSPCTDSKPEGSRIPSVEDEENQEVRPVLHGLPWHKPRGLAGPIGPLPLGLRHLSTRACVRACVSYPKLSSDTPGHDGGRLGRCHCQVDDRQWPLRAPRVMKTPSWPSTCV